MEVIRELCAFEGRGPGTDAERRAAQALAGRLRAIGRRAEIEPFFAHPQYALVHLIHAAAGDRRQPARDGPARGRLRPRPVRRGLDLPRPQHPPLPRPLAALSPRLPERRLPRQSPGRPRPAHPDGPLRRRPHRLRLLQGVQANPPASGARPPRPRPLPALLLARPRAPPPHPRRPHGRSRRDLAQRGPGDPHDRPDRRRLPPHRHRPLGDRARRLRQRLRRGRGPLRGRRAHRRPSAEPRRLDRPDRRRGVLLRGQPRLRPLPPRSSSTAPAPTSSTSTPSRTARSPTRSARAR